MILYPPPQRRLTNNKRFNRSVSRNYFTDCCISARYQIHDCIEFRTEFGSALTPAVGRYRFAKCHQLAYCGSQEKSS